MRRLPSTLSPTSIALYEQCPKKFEYSKIDKILEPVTVQMLLGTFTHAVLEDLMQLPPSKRNKQEAKQIATVKWETFATSKEFLSLDIPSKVFKVDIWRFIEGYFALENPFNVNVISTEQKIRVNLGDVPIYGVIDRLEKKNNKIVVTDYKTGKVPYGQYKNVAFGQLFIYAAALAENNTVVDKIQLLYIGGNSTTTASVTKVELDKIHQRVKTTWDNIQNDFKTEFLTKKSKLCDWCSYKSICPAWNNT